MVTKYTRSNRFSTFVSLATAAVDWQGLTPDQQALVVLDESGMPWLAGMPDLTERAEALLEAAHAKQIAGLTHGEDGYPLPAAQSRERRALDCGYTTWQSAPGWTGASYARPGWLAYRETGASPSRCVSCNAEPPPRR